VSSLEPASPLTLTAQDHGLVLLIRRGADGDQEALGQFYDATSHRHRETEELYILEGSLDVHGHHLGPGDYCAALGGSVHRSASTEHGCRFLVSASEEDELLGSAEPSHRGLLFVPDGRGTWGRPETGVAVRRVAIDARFGVATVLVRMAAGSRGAVRGQQIYVLDGEGRVLHRGGMGPFEFHPEEIPQVLGRLGPR